VPIKELTVADRRLKFVLAINEGLSLSEACRSFEISRPTGYMILSRYEQDGVDGLIDRSRAPHHRPQSVDQDMISRILAAKSLHGSWGPKKLKAHLELKSCGIQCPAASTIGGILKRAGLVKPRRFRSHCPSAPQQPHSDLSNELWCVDYKGQFRLKDRQFCYPLTITDRGTRYLVRCQALPDVTGRKAWPYLVGAFQEFGIPNTILTDNGSPFAAATLTGLTYLSLQWLKLGIDLERIDPGKPQQNGAHERMHRTLKDEAIYPVADHLSAQQDRFDAWRHEFNYERPHEALGQITPGSIYTASGRQFPAYTREFEYPEGVRVTRVRTNGTIRWQGSELFVSEVLIGECVALDHFEERLHALYVGKQPVAILDEAQARFLTATKAAGYINRLRKENQRSL